MEELKRVQQAAQNLLDNEREKAYRIVQRFLYIDKTGEGSLDMEREVQRWNRSHGINHNGLTLALVMDAMKRYPPETFEMPEQEEARRGEAYPSAGRDLDEHEIIAVQRFLGVTVDGKIGPQTMDAVWAWNQAMGIAHGFISEHMIELALDN